VQWYADHGAELACGRIHKTRRGHHLIYRMPDTEIRNSASKIAPGVDVRAEGGYVIWWPAHGLDAIGDMDDITPPPRWLIDLLVKAPAPTSSTGESGSIHEGGRNAHLTSLAGSMRRRGMGVQAIVAALLAENAGRCDPPLPDDEVRVIAGSISRYEPAPETEPEALPSWPAPIDLQALAKTDPTAPRFIVDDWLPCGYATLLAGHGGVGKSGIALYLAVCIALGRAFFGLPTQQRRVLYLSCEDRSGVLHWRLARICRHLGIALADLQGHLDILDLVGHETVLWERDPRTGLTRSAAYGYLRGRMTEHQTELLMVDGISDTYGGNENARSEVKRYVNALVALIPQDTGAVLLIGHIAKPAASGVTTSEGYSGSTGWHNSVRARWYLYPETTQTEDGDTGRTGDLLLDLQKSNLGRTDQSLRFHWDDAAHLFVGEVVGGLTNFDRRLRDQDEQDGILDAFRGCAEDGVYVPAATTGRRTAFHVLSTQKSFPDTLQGKANVRRFWRQIEVLRRMQKIIEDSIRRKDGHKTVTLCLADLINSSDGGESSNVEKNIRRTIAASRDTGESANAPGG
jgi:hypothetical protein